MIEYNDFCVAVAKALVENIEPGQTSTDIKVVVTDFKKEDVPDAMVELLKMDLEEGMWKQVIMEWKDENTLRVELLNYDKPSE